MNTYLNYYKIVESDNSPIGFILSLFLSFSEVVRKEGVGRIYQEVVGKDSPALLQRNGRLGDDGGIKFGRDPEIQIS
jgi:hypothetical protein